MAFPGHYMIARVAFIATPEYALRRKMNIGHGWRKSDSMTLFWTPVDIAVHQSSAVSYVHPLNKAS